MGARNVSAVHHALYRFYSHDGRLLYVGITHDPGRRFVQHAEDKPWWHEVAGISVERCDSRAAALAAEARAIEVERPVHNAKRPTVRREHGAPSQPVARVEWHCGVCFDLIADGAGYLTVTPEEAEEGNPARWAALHAACDQAPDSGALRRPVEQSRTALDLLRFAAALAWSPWIGDTDWPMFIHDATRRLEVDS